MFLTVLQQGSLLGCIQPWHPSHPSPAVQPGFSSKVSDDMKKARSENTLKISNEYSFASYRPTLNYVQLGAGRTESKTS